MDHDDDQEQHAHRTGTTSGSREVITLQIGRYANFVGTHYWNFQDELWGWAQDQPGGTLLDPYDPAVMFSSAGRVVTPRLLIFDTRDAFSSLHVEAGGSASGGGGGAADHAAGWGGAVQSYHQGVPRQPNAFQSYLAASTEPAPNSPLEFHGAAVGALDASGGGELIAAQQQEIVVGAKVRRHPFGLDDDVACWGDYLKSNLRRGTLQELPFRDAGAGAFETFASGGSGGDSAVDAAARELYADALRRRLEECDAVQGVQCVADARGGWAGLAASMLADARDECRSAPVVCYPVASADDTDGGGGGSGGTRGGGAAAAAAAHGAVNRALALHALSEVCTLVAPLSEAAAAAAAARSPHVALDARRPYHTSAVLGAALEAATSPFRFSSPAAPCRMDAWVNAALAHGGHGGANMKFAGLTLAFPFAERDGNEDALGALLDAGDLRDRLCWLGMPPPPPHVHAAGSSGSAHAPAALPFTVFSELLVARGLAPAAHLQSPLLSSALDKARQGGGGGRAAAVAAFRTPLPIPLSFPLVFRPSLDERGARVPPNHSSSGEDDRVLLGEAAALAGVECSGRLAPLLRGAAEAGLDVRSAAVLRELERNGLQRDDAAEAREALRAQAGAYERR
ncbi:Tubulin/FtsZ, GTPase domain-containing protein [Tribonema minus]|uniref:Tubulin/FtsZ, GTPase domain-containing protein n=1 Tax=Tribonema minus TaxID=303371 RepID=A0A835Z5A4_9STRA|nr:Tubulin/FtsZ, GTPase domain-containing protein [Tribonema minus]